MHNIVCVINDAIITVGLSSNAVTLLLAAFDRLFLIFRPLRYTQLSRRQVRYKSGYSYHLIRKPLFLKEAIPPITWQGTRIKVFLRGFAPWSSANAIVISHLWCEIIPFYWNLWWRRGLNHQSLGRDSWCKPPHHAAYC